MTLSTSDIAGFPFEAETTRYREGDATGACRLRGHGDWFAAVQRLRRGESTVTAQYLDAEGDRQDVVVDQPEAWLWTLLSTETRATHIYDPWLEEEKARTANARGPLTELLTS